MAPGRILVVLRAALVAAIMASAALANDYGHMADPAFCGKESACFKVRASDLGRDIGGWFGQYGMTLPQAALLLFIVLLVYSFFLRSRTYIQAYAAVLGLGSLISIYLIVAQAQIHAFCPYCMIVDTSILIGGASAFILMRAFKTEKEAETGLRLAIAPGMTFVWGLTAALATTAPYVWAAYPAASPLPGPIADMQVDGKVTIVSITDFECPFCRGAHPTLTALRELPDVAFKRIMAPLPMHPGAEPAARAYLCAPEEKRDELAEKLYGMEALDMTDENIISLARGVGMDPETTKACMSSEATEVALKQDWARYESTGGVGLPTTFIGKQVFVGFSSGSTPPKMVQAVEDAGKKSFQLPPYAMFLLVGGALLATVVWSWGRVVIPRPAVPRPVDPGIIDAENPKEDEKEEEAE